MSQPLVSADSHPSLSTEHGSGGEESRSARRWRVLVVEDVPSLQRLLVLMLQKAGHEVLTADNGLDAIEISSHEPLDAVLMDIQMPGLNGLEATRAIRSREAGSGHHLPIVAVTAHALAGDASSCHEAGADEYLRKPIDLDELMRVLARLIA